MTHEDNGKESIDCRPGPRIDRCDSDLDKQSIGSERFVSSSERRAIKNGQLSLTLRSQNVFEGGAHSSQVRL